MKCSNCNGSFDDSMAFCPYCGKPVKEDFINSGIKYENATPTGKLIGQPCFDADVIKSQNKKKVILAVVISVIVAALIAGGVVALVVSHNKNAEDYTLYDSICSDINDVESGFLVDGYVPKDERDKVLNEVKNYVYSEKDKGRVTECTDGEGSLYIKLSDDNVLIYTPKVIELKSNGDKGKITVIEHAEGQNTDNLYRYSEIADNMVNQNSSYEYDSEKDDILNSFMTIDKAKSLSGNSIIIWDGHGGYNEINHSFIQVSDDYKTVKSKNKDDVLAGRIISTTDGECLLTPEFFDYYYKEDSLKDSIIYLGTCASGVDDTLANVFLSKGAQVVVGMDALVSHDYDYSICKYFFSNLIYGNTAQKSLDKAADYVIWDTDYEENECNYNLFGNKDYCLTVPEYDWEDTTETTSSENDLTTIENLLMNARWYDLTDYIWGTGNINEYIFNTPGTVDVYSCDEVKENTTSVEYEVRSDTEIAFMFLEDEYHFKIIDGTDMIEMTEFYGPSVTSDYRYCTGILTKEKYDQEINSKPAYDIFSNGFVLKNAQEQNSNYKIYLTGYDEYGDFTCRLSLRPINIQWQGLSYSIDDKYKTSNCKLFTGRVYNDNIMLLRDDSLYGTVFEGYVYDIKLNKVIYYSHKPGGIYETWDVEA